MTVWQQLQPPMNDRELVSWGGRFVSALKGVFRGMLEGDVTFRGKVTTENGRIRHGRLVTVTPDTLLLTDDRVDVNVNAAVAMTLPLNPTQWQEIEVHDAGGNATANTITISAAGGVSLNGVVAGNVKIDVPYHYRRFLYNGSQWIGS